MHSHIGMSTQRGAFSHTHTQKNISVRLINAQLWQYFL